MAKFVNITANDTILTTAKVTKGLFTGDLGTVQGTSLLHLLHRLYLQHKKLIIRLYN